MSRRTVKGSLTLFLIFVHNKKVGTSSQMIKIEALAHGDVLEWLKWSDWQLFAITYSGRVEMKIQQQF